MEWAALLAGYFAAYWAGELAKRGRWGLAAQAGLFAFTTMGIYFLRVAEVLPR